jgi:hypothetical protein
LSSIPVLLSRKRRPPADDWGGVFASECPDRRARRSGPRRCAWRGVRRRVGKCRLNLCDGDTQHSGNLIRFVAPRGAELMNQILEIAQEEFWCMGINLFPPGYGIVKNSFHNVPQQMVDAWLYPTPVPTNPEQFFIEREV